MSEEVKEPQEYDSRKFTLSKHFQIDIGQDENGKYHGHVFCTVDKTIYVDIQDSIRFLLPNLTKQIRKKENYLKRFPLQEEQSPEKSLIVLQNGHPA